MQTQRHRFKRPTHPRRGNAINTVLWLLAGVVVLAGGTVGARQLWLSKAATNPNATATTHTVKREQLIVTVNEDGNLESAKNLDIKCEIAGGSAILWIIDDGTVVEAGAELVRLDQSNLEEQFRTQKGVYEKALASQIQAETDADAAEISVEEYVEGMYLKEMQLCEAQIKIALENQRSAQNILEHSLRMSRKGFVTPLQVEADQFAVQRSELDLKAAETSKTVLAKFTRAKTVKDLEGKRDAAKARNRSETAAVELEQGKLKRLEGQLAKAVIKAKQPGMVVYYKEGSRFGSSSTPIALGTVVRESQTIIQLPDLTQMQAKVPIHESKVELVKAGMRASLKVLDRSLQGTVMYVGNQPEQKSWGQSAVKEYPAIVRIDSDATNLKPGMTADVEILISDTKDVLTVPVAAVVDQAGSQFCWVQSASGPERRPLVLGATNDKMVEVKGGVLEGDQVILNPRAVVPDARVEVKDEKKDDVDTTKKFGQEKPFDPKTAGGPGAGAGAGGGGRRPTLQIKELDKDGDGKISKEEAPEFLKDPERFARMDTDGDGFITQAELTAAALRMQQRQPKPTAEAPM